MSEQSYSTGEVAKILGVSPSWAKNLARTAGLDVPRFGKRRDWVWSEKQLSTLRQIVHKRSKP